MKGEDSVVISKSALDDLLKQLVDAKQAANVLPPIGNTQDNSVVPNHQGDKATTNANVQQEAVTPRTNHTESSHRLQQKQQPVSKHIDLDYSDVPGLSPSSKSLMPQATEDLSVAGCSSGKH